jgi:hypothetical protein
VMLITIAGVEDQEVEEDHVQDQEICVVVDLLVRR